MFLSGNGLGALQKGSWGGIVKMGPDRKFRLYPSINLRPDVYYTVIRASDQAKRILTIRMKRNRWADIQGLTDASLWQAPYFPVIARTAS